MSEIHSDSARDAALERFARRAFADGVDAVDADTCARLASARRRAVAAAAGRGVDLRLPRLAPAPAWVAAGAAAALVVALAAVLRPGPDAPAGTDARVAQDLDVTPADGAPLEPIAPPDALASPADLELLAGGVPDVLDVLEEDLEFYAWLEQQPELAMDREGP
ncbi:MAG TPA: hypothetical protein VF339_12080 [Gammaproteobacteria bacterium]